MVQKSQLKGSRITRSLILKSYACISIFLLSCTAQNFGSDNGDRWDESQHKYVPRAEPNMQVSEHDFDQRFANLTVPTQPLTYTPDPPREGLVEQPEMREFGQEGAMEDDGDEPDRPKKKKKSSQSINQA